MIKNIIFDMGGVLIRFDPPYFIQRLGITGEDVTLLYREVFRSVEWVQLDRGSLSDADAISRMQKRLPVHLHNAVETLVSMWDRPILPIEGMNELVQELKTAGYGIYLLSNASTHQHDYWPRIPGYELFDGTLISADVHLLKPEEEIYQLLLEHFSLKGDECVFVDDNACNIEAAINCGINGVVFHGSTSHLRQILKEDFGVSLSDEGKSTR